MIAPVIVPGAKGRLLNAALFVALVAHPFDAVTVIFPVLNPVKKDTFKFFVPCPLLIIAFAGTVHVYEVAFVTIGQLYANVDPAQTPVLVPVIDVGVDNVPPVPWLLTAIDEIKLHPFASVTVTVYVAAVKLAIDEVVAPLFQLYK